MFSAVINSTSGNDSLQGGDQNTNFYFSFSRQAPVTLGGTDTVTDLGGADRVTFSSLSDVKLVIASANPGINNDATNVVVTETNLAGNQAMGSITIARSIEQISASDVVVDASNVDDPSINPALTGITQTQGASKGYILAGTAGDDTIDAANLPDAVGAMIFGGDGNDTITGHSSAGNMIFGGTGNDNIAGGSSIDIINGGDGNDTIKGQMGNDVISGQGGNDEIFLGQNAGMNEGNDIVKFAQLASRDTVNNFSAYSGGSGDQIQLTGGARTALDDGAGGANGTFLWDTNHNFSNGQPGVINLSDGQTEAVYVNFTGVGGPVGQASNQVNGNALAQWANMGGGNALTASGADALFVVATNDAKTLIYSYAETNTTVEAGDFSLVATLDASLTVSEAQASIVLA